jgi:hypothetical protein
MSSMPASRFVKCLSAESNSPLLEYETAKAAVKHARFFGQPFPRFVGEHEARWMADPVGKCQENVERFIVLSFFVALREYIKQTKAVGTEMIYSSIR